MKKICETRLIDIKVGWNLRKTRGHGAVFPKFNKNSKNNNFKVRIINSRNSLIDISSMYEILF